VVLLKINLIKMAAKFPELKSERLRLGELSVKDIPTIVEYAGNPNISVTTLNIPHPYSEKDAVNWISMAYQGFNSKWQYTFGIYLESTDEFIGGIGLHLQRRYDRAEIGYWVAEPFWNKGYCSEATGLILDYGFKKLKLHKIIATHLVSNLASGKVMINNGMIKESELKDHYKKDKEYRSVIQYRMTKDEYDAFKRT
jgi:RimJ/RimL family protein N-acetyltransferase